MGRAVTLKGDDARAFVEAWRMSKVIRELAVPCSYCGVKIDERCKSKRTGKPVDFHRERSKLAIRIKVLVALKHYGALSACEVAEVLWPDIDGRANARNAGQLLNRMWKEGMVKRRWPSGSNRPLWEAKRK